MCKEPRKEIWAKGFVIEIKGDPCMLPFSFLLYLSDTMMMEKPVCVFLGHLVIGGVKFPSRVIQIALSPRAPITLQRRYRRPSGTKAAPPSCHPYNPIISPPLRPQTRKKVNLISYATRACYLQEGRGKPARQTRLRPLFSRQPRRVRANSLFRLPRNMLLPQ